MARETALSLFSGVGGIDLALQSAFITVAYCDNDPACQASLLSNMKRGLLPKAPVFGDVTKLSGNDTRQNPTMIYCSFPCTDISCSRQGLGITGPQSKLGFESVRLADELPSVKYVFYENSSCILTRGLPILLKKLYKRGFIVAYGIFNASDVGAPHRRSRWYCLASRSKGAPPPVSPSALMIDWSREPVPRVRPRRNETSHAESLTRNTQLGNAVCVPTVAFAYMVLRAALEHQLPTVNPTTAAIGATVVVTDGRVVHPRDGVGCFSTQHRAAMCMRPRYYRKLVVPALHAPSRNLVVSYRGVVIKRDSFATPQSDSHHQYRYLAALPSTRSTRLLSNLLYWEKATQAYMKQHQSAPFTANRASDHWDINPQFVEWLMGFPKDWTKL